MESVDEPSLDQKSKATITSAADPAMGLKKLWKTSLLVQGRVDSKCGLIEEDEGRRIGIGLIDLAMEMLGGEDLKFAQALLIRGASLKSKKQHQKLFPSRILNKCLFKSRGGALRSIQGYGEETASYAVPDSGEGSGTRQFGSELSEHLQSLKERFSGKPGKDEAKAIEELALYSLAHAISVFRDEVRKVIRESKPFEVAARAVGRAYEKGLTDAQDGVMPAYCGSVLRRLEMMEKLGLAKSTKIFNKYLATWDKKKIGISLDTIIGKGSFSADSFPELHHLPIDEFLTLASESSQIESSFLKLLSEVSQEITLESRELARFDALTNLYFSQEFQIKENEKRMEPVQHCVATRPLISAYRQVRDHLDQLGILGSPCRHFFGWYSIPRVMETFWIGQCESLSVRACLPLGTNTNPWSEALSDLRMEYRLAKVQRNFYEPPLASLLPSAFAHLSWELESLGVARDCIRLEKVDEALGTLTLSFDYANARDGDPLTRRRITYTNADISMAQPAGLVLPPETAPIFFQSLENELPSALLFVGDNVVKELPLYHRYSYAKNVALYILETKIAIKIRKERRKPSEKSSKKSAQEVKASVPVEPELTGMAKMASDLLKTDKGLMILQQDALVWAREVLEKIATDQKVAGKSRRNFRRLHRQLEHRATRGYSNRLEGEFMINLAALSRQFDAEIDAS